MEFSDGGGDAATGHRRGVILARNVADDPCSLTGYADLVFIDAGGSPVAGVVEPGEGFMTDDPGPAAIVLLPGWAAMADLAWDAVGGGPDLAAAMIAPYAGADPVRLEVAWASTDIAHGATVKIAAWQYDSPGIFAP